MNNFCCGGSYVSIEALTKKSVQASPGILRYLHYAEVVPKRSTKIYGAGDITTLAQ